MALSRRGGIGSWTRMAIALRVGAMVIVAAFAALLASWLAERPGLHRRWDATAWRTGSLDPATLDILRSMPGPVTVEVFFRIPPWPWTVVALEVQREMRELLVIAKNEVPAMLDVVEHDPSDVVAAQERLGELALQGEDAVNVLVVRCGEQKALLRLFRDVAEIDPGSPDPFVPPSVARFAGEEAFASALKKVSQTERVQVVFSTGHGERDPRSTAPRQLGRLRSALEADGFRVGMWDSEVSAGVPSGARILVIVDPRQPFSEGELALVRSFVDGGGRLFAAPGVDAFAGDKSLVALLRSLGITVEPGIVCQPVTDPLGGRAVDGVAACADLVVGPEGMPPNHPVTAPLVRGGRRVRLTLCGSLARGAYPADGVLLELLASARDSWRDLPDERGEHDFSRAVAEPRGPITLCLAAAFPPPSAANAADSSERMESRVMALGCPDALGMELVESNLDFALNAFNWLASREFRVGISPRGARGARIDVRGKSFVWITRIAGIVLPGLCLSAGLVLYVRRRRT